MARIRTSGPTPPSSSTTASRSRPEIRVAASAAQTDQLLTWAPGGERVWAVENANGLGRLLAQQLVAKGETVVDVPAALACRARKLSGHSARKTDEYDARSAAIAATYNRGLRRVRLDNLTAVLGLLVEPAEAVGVPAAEGALPAARAARRPPRASGPGRTDEDEPEGRVTGFNLNTGP